MGGEPTRPERIMRRIKNNPIVAVLVVGGSIVASLAAFTNAAQRLLSLVGPRDRGPDIAGTWVSDTLINPFAQNDRFLVTFDLSRSAETLTGSIRSTSVTGRYDVVGGIMDGSVDGDHLTFAVLKQALVGSETVQYRDLFFGQVASEEIRFTMQSERPWEFPPQEFVARRVE